VSLATSRALGTRWTVGGELDGTRERSPLGAPTNGQWLRRITVGETIDANTNLSLSLRGISGTGGFAQPGVNLAGSFRCIQQVLPGMMRNRWGRIINIASVHALRASAFKSAYVTAKHGLLGLTRVTALEGAPYGVTCNAICPSYVRTALVEKQIADQARVHGIPESEVVEKIMVAEAPIHRLLEPDEVAKFATYLCSDEASGITGSALTIDCGWTAQ